MERRYNEIYPPTHTNFGAVLMVAAPNEFSYMSMQVYEDVVMPLLYKSSTVSKEHRRMIKERNRVRKRNITIYKNDRKETKDDSI